MSEVTQATETTSTDIATLPPEQRAAIVLESSKAEAQLMTLVQETADITEVKDKDSRTMAHNAAMRLKNARIAIEKTGKAARDDANAFSKAVIAEEKRLTAIITPEETRIFKLRDEYDQQVEAERQERERKERERVAAIRGQIDAIKSLPLDSANDTSEQLHGTIHDLMDLPIGDDFAEFKEEAEAAKWEAISALQQLWDAATEREAAAARLKAEEERLQASVTAWPPSVPSLRPCVPSWQPSSSRSRLSIRCRKRHSPSRLQKPSRCRKSCRRPMRSRRWPASTCPPIPTRRQR